MGYPQGLWDFLVGFWGFSRFYGVSLWLLGSSHVLFVKFLRIFWGLLRVVWVLWGFFDLLVVFEVCLWFYGIFS